MFLRCGIAGILGGLLLISSPEFRLLRQGLVLVTVGCASLVIWSRGLGGSGASRPQSPAIGPTFEVDTAEPQEPATTTTTNLAREVRRVRERQKRAGD